MTPTLPPVEAVDTPREFWFRRPNHIDPIQEVVSVKRAQALINKGWELLSVGPLPEAEEPETAPTFAEAVAGAALATGVQE